MTEPTHIAWLETARGVLRFWWIVLIGVIFGAIVGASIGYHIGWGMPPTLEARDKPTYTAKSLLLVNGPESPFIRNGKQQSRPDRITPDGQTIPGGTETVPPDVKLYINAANILAFEITGDAVEARRKQMFGELPGRVTASALYASVGLRYRAGPLPYMEIVAQSSTADRARNLATATAEAFQAWLEDEQRKPTSRIRGTEKMLIEITQRPDEAIASGGTKPTLSVVAFLAISGLSVLLAIMLDRTFPRRDGRRAYAQPLPPRDPDDDAGLPYDADGIGVPPRRAPITAHGDPRE